MIQSIKHILASWLQSLKVLTPAHGKLFFLVTLKTIYETYGILFKKFWWLFLVCIGFDVLYKTSSCNFGVYNEICIISTLLWSVLGFVTFLTVRPSINLKTYDYYSNYFWHFLYFLMITYSPQLFWFLFFLISRGNIFLISFSFFLEIIIPIITLLLISPIFYMSPLWLVLIFSSLDSESEVIPQMKAVWRGIKMVFYNYPFFMIMAIITAISCDYTRKFIVFIMKFSGISNMISQKVVYFIASDLATLIVPIFFCFVSNFYIKQVHEEFKRYF